MYNQRMKILTAIIFSLAIFVSFSPAQVCTPTPSGIVAWYPGDGNANDISGNANHGTLQNGATFAAGQVGQAFNLDGNDDSVQLALNQNFQNFTLETWVKPLSAVNDSINQELIFGQSQVAQLVVRPGTSGGNQAVFQFRDSGNAFQQVVSTTDIPLNSWTHLAGTYDGSTLRLYINGNLNAQSTPTNTTLFTCNAPYFIGGFPAGTNCNLSNPAFQFFNGLIDEATVYDRALSAAEIQAIAGAGTAGKCKQVVTAASVAVSGRVLSPGGKAISKARVALTDQNGDTRTTISSPFGYFRFEAVEVGQTYIFSIFSKRYRFQPQVLTINEALTDLNFTAQE